jgi:activator of HSP90 ATPase
MDDAWQISSPNEVVADWIAHRDHIISVTRLPHILVRTICVSRLFGQAKNQNPEDMMSQTKGNAALANLATRRHLIVGGAFAFSGLAVASSSAPPGKAPAPKPENRSRTSLHQQVDLNASPQRIYAVLLDSVPFSAFSGAPAEIHGEVGGAFVMFGGRIEGRNIELVANRRIVQAWRPTHWEPGVYSIVKFELAAQGSGSRVMLDHTGFPQGEFDSLGWGWNAHYWEPLRKYFA